MGGARPVSVVRAQLSTSRFYSLLYIWRVRGGLWGAGAGALTGRHPLTGGVGPPSPGKFTLLVVWDVSDGMYTMGGCVEVYIGSVCRIFYRFGGRGLTVVVVEFVEGVQGACPLVLVLK